MFLKTEEKKREAARPKTNGSAPPIPVEPTPTPTPAVTKPDVQLAQGDVAVPPDQSATPEESAEQVPATAAELQTKNDPLQVSTNTTTEWDLLV